MKFYKISDNRYFSYYGYVTHDNIFTGICYDWTDNTWTWYDKSTQDHKLGDDSVITIDKRVNKKFRAWCESNIWLFNIATAREEWVTEKL